MSPLQVNRPETPARARNSRSWVIGGIASLLALYVVLEYGPWLSVSQRSWLSDIAWALFSLAAALRCFLTAFRHRRWRERTGWYLLGAAAFVWFLGMAYLIFGQLRRADFPPYPTLANYLFMSFAPLFTAGVFFLTARNPERRISWNRVANLGLVSTTALTVALLLLFEPHSRSAETTEVLVLSIADPAAFGIAALFTLTCLWLRDFAFRPAISWLLLASITAHAVSDQLYFASILARQDVSLNLEFLWLLAFTFQYWAAFERDQDSAIRGTYSRPRRRQVQSFAEAILPPALVVGTLLLALGLREHLSDRLFVMVAPLVVIFAIILGLREWWTHRRETELLRRLLKADARFRQVLAASPAVVFSCPPHPDFPATFLSREALAGLGLKEPDASLWATRVHQHDRDLIADDFNVLMEKGSASSEYRLCDDRGVYRWVQRRMVLVRDDKGRPLEVLGVIVDVSSTKQDEIQMLQGQRLEALGKLAGGIAHDFNNLLTTILGNAEFALSEPATGGVARTSLREIEAAGEKAASLTSQLLTFSREQQVELKVLDVNKTIASMTSLLERLIGEHIQIEVEEHHPSVAIESDSGYLESVVMNLAVNARDAMPSGGQLKIEIDQVIVNKYSVGSLRQVSPGTYGVISVSDTGTGMSEETLSRIFDPFFSTKPKGQGTGLGLSTAYAIVRQHRGLIDVSSRLGEGSCFRVFLPLADAASAVSQEVEAATRLPGGNESLLVVDDDEAIIDLMRRALVSLGYRVTTASSAEEALDLIRDKGVKSDLLLTDVVLPGISGRQLAEMLRQERPETRVIFMTGHTEDSRLLDEAALGRRKLLRKPLSLSDLARTIRQTLDEVATSS